MSAKIITCMLVLASLAVRQAHAQSAAFSDTLVQAPHLSRPQAGAVSGALATFQLPSEALTRGLPQIPFPYQAPSERGAPLIGVFPSYSAEQGASEWGLGFSLHLSIFRSRVGEQIDYTQDDWVSPWGRLVEGQDGIFYVQGLHELVRVYRVANGFKAIDAQGTSYWFTHADQTQAGPYAYYLSLAESARGARTAFVYESNASSYPFVSSVSYGSAATPDAQRIRFSYQMLSKPVVSYASGERRDLDRKVSQVTVEARQAGTSTFALRWALLLEYEQTWGPAVRLRSVTRRWPDGSQEPAVRYGYGQIDSHLASASLVELPALAPVIGQFGASGLRPDNGLLFDVDHDGDLDLESHTDQALARQTDQGFQLEFLPAIIDTGDGRALCRPPPSSRNTVRTLARLIKSSPEPQVLYTQGGSASTRVLVCDRAAEHVLLDTQLEAGWDLSATTRLVDINGDARADLVRVRGGRVASMLARSAELGFEPGPSQALEPRTSLAALWLQDMQGDGLADLVGRAGANLLVWAGTGRGRFVTSAESYSFLLDGRRISDLTPYHLSFLDVDGDGLSDAVLTKSRTVYLFRNDGRAFQQVLLPALSAARVVMPPVVTDFVAGEVSLTFVQEDRVNGIALRAVDTGLLTAIDDGHGAKVDLGYARGPGAAGLGAVPRVLVRETLRAAGESTQETMHDYALPVVHREGGFLIGYGSLHHQRGHESEWLSFLHDEQTSDVLLSVSTEDALTPEVTRVRERAYDLVRSFGIPWRRLRQEVEGYRARNGTYSLLETKEIGSYEREICPQQVIVTSLHGEIERTLAYAEPTRLADALLCLVERETLLGTHRDRELDLRLERQVQYSEWGEAEQSLLASGDGSTLTLQKLRYDDFGRPEQLTDAIGQTTHYIYDPLTGVLDSIREPSGAEIRIVDSDPVTCRPRLVRTDRGGNLFDESYRDDGWERLTRSFNNLSPGSESQPQTQVRYRLPTDVMPGLITSDVRVGSQGTKSNVSISTARGEELAQALRVPEGWALGEVTVSTPLEHLTEHLRSDLPISDFDAYEHFFKGLRSLDRTQLTSASTVFTRQQTVQRGLARVITGRAWLDARGLVEELSEQDTYHVFGTRDVQRRLLFSRDEQGHESAFTYDALGRLVRVTLADGTQHARSFDEFGRAAVVSRAGVGKVTYHYQAGTSLLDSKVFRDRQGELVRTERYAYDEIGRVASTDFVSAQGTSDRVSWFYDGEGRADQKGRVTRSVANGLERITTYRGDGLIETLVEHVPGWLSLETRYQYGQGNVIERVTRTTRAGNVVREILQEDYGYDELGRLQTLKLNGQDVFVAHYDALSRIDYLELPEDRKVVPLYESETGRQRGLAVDFGARVAQSELEQDARGRVSIERTSWDGKEHATRYDYDARGMLETASGVNARYQYDAAGRPTYARDSSGARTIVTGDVGQNLAGLGYDASGRLTSRAGTEFEYSARGLLDTVSRASSHVRYGYDADGERVVKWDEQGVVLAYLSDGLLSNQGFIRPLEAFGMSLGSLSRAGLALVATDMSGKVYAHATGDISLATAYGVRTDAALHDEVLDFAHHGFDRDAGTVRLGARDYDPSLGAFHTPDPLLLEQPERCVDSPQQCNLYGYAQGNPLSYADPNGKFAFVFLVGAAILLDQLTNFEAVNAPGADGRVDTSMAPETKAAIAVGLTALASKGAIALRSGLNAGDEVASSAWRALPRGLETRRLGDFWVKRVNPDASLLMQTWGRHSLKVQVETLHKLGDLAVPFSYRSGMLFTQHVSGPASLGVWARSFVAGSRRIGLLNDIRPRNMGANGLIFDPALDLVEKGVLLGGTAAATGVGIYVLRPQKGSP